MIVRDRMIGPVMSRWQRPAGGLAVGRKGRRLKRFKLVTISFASLLRAVAAVAVPASAASHATSGTRAERALSYSHARPFCQNYKSTCVDIYKHPPGQYVGHDEPSVLFNSSIAGSGNNMTYTVTLPSDPVKQPNASGVGGTTWNFELRPTFWFGLTMCDNQSAPEYTKTCTPDSDSNNLVGANPKASDYIGKHPGTAYMELQFYGPGYVPQFLGFGCAAHQYCAAMTIDSYVNNLNTGVANTAACNQYVLGGIEPINWAYVTKSGKAQGPANPLASGTVTNPVFTSINPNYSEDLLMNPGDVVRVHMHDTPAGFQVILSDLTTGQSGKMTASLANGFGHIVYTPKSSACHEAPYAFHPAYSTASVRGNVWTAHTYNVAYSDELGHFENCLAVDAATGACTKSAESLDGDDNGCVQGKYSTVVKIDGCFGAELDYDGQSYRLDWPGTLSNPGADRALHPTPVVFTSPTTNGQNYSSMAFETDMPAFESAQLNPPDCNTTTGANCVNPPSGAKFYPIFSTAKIHGSCVWREGGKYLPGTISDFGGNSTKEYGPLLKILYPNTGFTTVRQYDDYNSGLITNPCPASTP